MAAYTQAQLITAYTNANAGSAPSAATQQLLLALANQNATGTLTDAETLQRTVDLAADGTTAVSVGTYQFFTGVAPSVAGLTALGAAFNGTGAQANLNAENRFIAQSVALATQNAAAKTAFNAAYGQLSVSAATAQAYNVIIGNVAAAAAGVDVAAAVAYLSSASSVTYFTNFIKANTNLTSAADIDLAVKAAIVGEILFSATTYNNGAGIGSYATATNNLLLDLAADGKLVADNAAGINLFTAYPGGETQGQVFDLTFGQDSLVGTNANDVFTAGYVNNGAGALVASLDGVDVVDGSLGTDRINVTLGNDNVAPTLKSIEQVAVRFTNAAGNLSLAASTGVTDVIAGGSTTAGTFTSVGSAALTVFNQNQNVNLDGAAAATTTKLNLVNATGGLVIDLGVTKANAGKSLAIDSNASTVVIDSTQADAYTSTTINATGKNSITFTDSAASLTAVTVTGAGSLTLPVATPLAALKTLDASDNTGGVTLATTSTAVTTLTGGNGADSLTIGGALAATAVINTGAGNDTVSFTAAPAAGVTVNGGDGTDSIGFTDAIYTTVSGYTAPQKALISNFETLLISDAAAAGGTYDLTMLSGITNFTLGAGVIAGKTTTVNNFASGATLTLNGALQTNTGTVAVVLKADGTADSLNIVATGTNDNAGNQANVSIANIETVKFTATSTDTTPTATYTLALTNAAALTAVTITGNEKAAYTIDASATKLATIDASANTAGVTINASAVTQGNTAALTITGTAKADSFTLHDNTTVSGNGGNDTFVVTASTSGQTYSTITDANKGDILTFTDKGTETFTTAKIALASTAVFQDYLDAAAAGNGGTNGAISWFQWDGNTYVVEDLSAAATFQNGTDLVVKLTGLVDLSTATGAGTNVLTLA